MEIGYHTWYTVSAGFTVRTQAKSWQTLTHIATFSVGAVAALARVASTLIHVLARLAVPGKLVTLKG